LDEIAVLLGGHTAEKYIFGEVTTGASSDLREATRLARNLITIYGMSEVLGPRTFGEREEMVFLGRDFHEQKDYSEKASEKIDNEINSLIGAAQIRAQVLLKKKRKILDKIVDVLLKRETIEKEEFESLFTSTTMATKEPVADPKPNNLPTT